MSRLFPWPDQCQECDYLKDSERLLPEPTPESGRYRCDYMNALVCWLWSRPMYWVDEKRLR